MSTLLGYDDVCRSHEAGLLIVTVESGCSVAAYMCHQSCLCYHQLRHAPISAFSSCFAYLIRIQRRFPPSALTARWSAPKNRSLVVSIIHVGSGTGVVVAMMLSEVLCDHGFAGGWPSVFYVFGMIGCLWSGAWFLLCYDSPSTHREYRQLSKNTGKGLPVPRT